MEDWHVQFCAGVPEGGKSGSLSPMTMFLIRSILSRLSGTCQGDTGGPLMMFGSSRQWMLVGLISSGIGCARAEYSGIYTRVAAFEEWIKSYTNNSIWVRSEAGSENPIPSTTPPGLTDPSTTMNESAGVSGSSTTTGTTTITESSSVTESLDNDRNHARVGDLSTQREPFRRLFHTQTLQQPRCSG